MSESNDKRPVLESATSLKGRKAKPKHSAKRWIVLVLIVALIGAGVGIIYGTDLLKPDVVEQEQTSVSASDDYVKTTLIERPIGDVQNVKVAITGGDTFSITSHVKYDENGQMIVDENNPITKYTLDGQEYFKLIEAPIVNMMSYASAIQTVHTIEENAKDLSIYGLNKPTMTLTYTYKDGTTATLLFGNKVPTGSYYYAMLKGDPNVYMMYSSVFNIYNRPLNALHVIPTLPMLTDTTVNGILIEQSGKETIELGVIDVGDNALGITTLKILQPIQYDSHSTRGTELLTAAIAMAPTGYAGHAETPEELEAFGLAEPRMHIVVRGTDETGEQKIENDFRIGSEKDGMCYVAIDDSGDIYTMSSSLISFVSNATVGHLADQFTNLINITKVDTVTVEGNNEKYALSITNEVITAEDGTEKTISSYFFDGNPTEEEPFKKLYQEVIGTLLDKVSSNYNHDGKVVAKVTYKLNNGMDDFVVEYLEYDDNYYAVRRDGMTIFLIKHEKIERMLTSCQQFREGTFTY